MTTAFTIDDQHSYDRLMVAIESSLGKLDLLIAVCDDRTLQAQISDRYEQELDEQQLTHCRVRLRRQEPSLQGVLQELGASVWSVVTVEGASDLLQVEGVGIREQAQLMGYLQWRREALREFAFPVVLWLTRSLVDRVVRQAPDFWGWRGGVFWFGAAPVPVKSPPQMPLPESPPPVPRPDMLSASAETEGTKGQLNTLLEQIERLEQQPQTDPTALADLYKQLGELYARRYDDDRSRQYAIQVFRRAVELQRQIGDLFELPARGRPALAENLERLGNLYFELQNNVRSAADCYEEALGIYREVGDRLGEANTLQAIADVLQFKKRSDEALENYEAAIGIYREVGARLGEANTLQAIADVLQFKKRSDEALENYEAAIGIYREVGDRLGEANALQAIGDLQSDFNVAIQQFFQPALKIYEQIGDQYSQGRILADSIAPTYLKLGQPYQAKVSYQKALEFWREIQYTPGIEQCEQSLTDLNQLFDNPSVPVAPALDHHPTRRQKRMTSQEKAFMGFAIGVAIVLLVWWLKQ
ncbi:tetratricopeptide repeat protein [Phormidesmis priestleyi]